jgi:predicted negative regulator of RcsB-dependent stress response
MNKAIKLSSRLITDATQYAKVYSRSTPKQIEHWAKIGKIAEENPDLSYEFINELLLAKQQLEDDDVTPYEFDT